MRGSCTCLICGLTANHDAEPSLRLFEMAMALAVRFKHNTPAARALLATIALYKYKCGLPPRASAQYQVGLAGKRTAYMIHAMRTYITIRMDTHLWKHAIRTCARGYRNLVRVISTADGAWW